VLALTITETATTKLKELIAKHAPESGAYLRVYVAGGGCSGMSYGMALDEQLKDGDEIVHNNGIKVVVDEKSLPYLDGSTVDFVETVQGTGFAITNTNNWSTCGCGKSFSPKGEAPPDAAGAHHDGHNH
jgi:iron-sulfur cluster assembly protein